MTAHYDVNINNKKIAVQFNTPLVSIKKVPFFEKIPFKLKEC